MAIDTREKRFSMLNFGDGTNIHTLFEADSSVDLDDRQHLLDCYSGIAFLVAGISVFIDTNVSVEGLLRNIANRTPSSEGVARNIFDRTNTTEFLYRSLFDRSLSNESLFRVNTNHGTIPVEWQGAMVAFLSADILAESLLRVDTADRTLSSENLFRAFKDGISPSENLLRVFREGENKIEFSGKQSADTKIRIEHLLVLERLNSVLTSENLQRNIKDGEILSESLLAIENIDKTLLSEILLRVDTSNRTLPSENLFRAFKDEDVPISWRGGVIAFLSANILSENLLRINASNNIFPSENLFRVLRGGKLPAEWRGGIISSLSVNILSENLLRFTFNKNISSEWKSRLIGGRASLTIEYLARQERLASFLLEGLSRVLLDPKVLSENQRIIIGEGKLPAEWKRRFSFDRTLQIENLVVHTITAAQAVEFLSRTKLDAILAVEWLSVSATFKSGVTSVWQSRVDSIMFTSSIEPSLFSSEEEGIIWIARKEK